MSQSRRNHSCAKAADTILGDGLPVPLPALERNMNRAFLFDLRDRQEPYWAEHTPQVSHIVVEMIGATHLSTPAHLKTALQRLLPILGLNPIAGYECEHVFSSGGFTYVQPLRESHIAFHSWPEREYTHVDVVTCKTEDIPAWKYDPGGLKRSFIEVFKPTSLRVLLLWY
ncbi:MAG: S-adenosylmethionine decarboxylase [Phycisphaerales bacterium]|nr:S-adenosylmethionine decarboxylase [Phycisphaerales bacterium]